MKNLRRLGLCMTLISLLSVSTFAGITNTPPCAPPDPGILNTPPCGGGQLAPDPDASVSSASTPESSAAEAWVAEVTVDLIESVLSIF